jgi:hypothetical protein
LRVVEVAAPRSDARAQDVGCHNGQETHALLVFGISQEWTYPDPVRASENHVARGRASVGIIPCEKLLRLKKHAGDLRRDSDKGL